MNQLKILDHIANLRFSGWGNSLGRIPLPDRTILTLYDYRKRIATYRTDLDLLASHQNFAWIPVWDDHGMALFHSQKGDVREF